MSFYQVLNKSLNEERTGLHLSCKSSTPIEFSLDWCSEILLDMKGADDDDSEDEDTSSELSDVRTLR
jgi:hypothetical protein